jgi:leader peptidase (prepilin peptidase)/N-methyltransferase
MPFQEVFLSPLVLALFGLCIGSFLNVVIHRLPLMLERGWKMESADLLGVAHEETPAITLSTPRSRCPSCGHAIAWYENIPLASWLWLRARCSACKAPISARYPLIEVATALLFALVGWRFGAEPVALLWCFFCAVLVALAGIDWDTTLLPDNLTLPLLWAAWRARCSAGRSRSPTRSGAPSSATSRSGRSTGCSSSPRARKAWASATSSCSPRSARGWAGR